MFPFPGAPLLPALLLIRLRREQIQGTYQFAKIHVLLALLRNSLNISKGFVARFRYCFINKVVILIYNNVPMIPFNKLDSKTVPSFKSSHTLKDK